MEYLNQFSRQWETFTNDFAITLQKTHATEITLKSVSEWYKTNSYRWKSMVETEGMMLEQQGNPELKDKLTDAIDNFSFTQAIYEGKKPSLSLYSTIGAALIAAALLILFFLKHFTFWFVLIIAVIIIFGVLYSYAKNYDKYDITMKKTLIEQYTQQLNVYKDTLIEICKRYIK